MGKSSGMAQVGLKHQDFHPDGAPADIPAAGVQNW
jgi:hypothetical protein